MSKLIKFIHRSSLLLAIEMAATCILSYYAGSAVGILLQQDTHAISPLWCMISAILVMQASWSKSLESGALRFIGSFAGSLMGYCCFYLFGINSITYCVGIFLLVVILCYSGHEPYLRLAVLTMSVVFVAASIHPQNQLEYISASRLLESVVGIMITLITRFITIGVHELIDDLIQIKN